LVDARVATASSRSNETTIDFETKERTELLFEEGAMDEPTKVIWFATAVLIEVIQNLALYLYLRRAGVKVSFAFSGTPGYLDKMYHGLRRDRSKSSLLVILVRILSLANVVAAAIYFIFGFR
jgi:hypothetical protein